MCCCMLVRGTAGCEKRVMLCMREYGGERLCMCVRVCMGVCQCVSLSVAVYVTVYNILGVAACVLLYAAACTSMELFSGRSQNPYNYFTTS